MIKIENVEVTGWEHAIRGMRNPMNSWDKSDSDWNFDCIEDPETFYTYKTKDEYEIGPNDKKLMMSLCNAGTDHRKFMRYIIVYLDITAPLYWWKEFETYRAGVFPGQEPINPMDIETNSCSTMHTIHKKEFDISDFSTEHLITGPDSPLELMHDTIAMLNTMRKFYLETKDKKYWWQMIQLLPSSYNQKRTVMCNYEVLCNIYKSRRTHKLDCWHTLCDWMETLPMSELITGEEQKLEFADQPGLALGA